MNFSRLFIRRPVATALLMVAILLAGAVAYRQLPVSALPQVDYPTIQVLTFYPGASPEVMGSSVTAPLERQFGQMPGLNQMTSTSSGGCSLITLQFTLDLSLDVAEQEVQAAINAATTFLPRDLPNPPIYSKVNPADTPILTLALTSQTLPLLQVEDLADTRLAQKISELAGVGLVSISGGQRPAVRIRANPTALAAYSLTLEDLRAVIAAANVNQAKGGATARSRPMSSVRTTSSCRARSTGRSWWPIETERRSGSSTSPRWSTMPRTYNLSLMALTIATGFVVDDAIVMIENIARYVEEGEPMLQAALKGSKQIGFTILSLTISLIAVLIPLLFMSDVVGRLFREFAIILGVTIVISAFVSLTLTPMMCSRLLRHGPEAQQGRFSRVSQDGLERIIKVYARTLRWVLDRQTATLWVTVGILFLTVLGAILALLLCGTELSVIGMIGIILLIGIVKKNAIMMIDFALEAERKEGRAPFDAIYQACLLRFRPIMMTTMAAMLGALPLALGTGMGAELRRPLGISIVGGLMVSQMLTLYTTPVVYLYLDRARLWFSRRRTGTTFRIEQGKVLGSTGG